MYSGTSSVPKIYSGSKSRLERTVGGEPCDCKWEQETDLKEKLTLEWYASLMECCLPWWVAFLCPPWLWGFLFWSKGRGCEVMEECASGFAGHLRGLFHWLRERIGSDDWLAYVIGIPKGRVFFRMWKVFIEQCLWFSNWRFSVDFAPRGSCRRVFGLSKVPEFVWEK
jgi:hypothetical protein